MPNIVDVLERADILCTHGSSNYKYLSSIASNFHKLLALAMSPMVDPDSLRDRILTNVAAQRGMNSPYHLDDQFSAIKTDPFLSSFAQSFSRSDVGHIETLIAECVICQKSEDDWFKATYVEQLKASDQRAIPALFYEDIYLNGMRSLIYGFGNCELRADALLVELIRAGSFNNLHVLQLLPKDAEGCALEELFLVAVGHWPKAGCQLIVPWFQGPRVFEWKGSLGDSLSELMTGLGEPTMDLKNTSIKTVFSLDQTTIGPVKRMVDHSYDALLSLKTDKFKKIRALYCLFLENVIGHVPSTEFRQGSRGPYWFGYQQGFFSGFAPADALASLKGDLRPLYESKGM